MDFDLALDKFFLIVKLALDVGLQIQGFSSIVLLLDTQLPLRQSCLLSEVATSIFLLFEPIFERFFFLMPLLKITRLDLLCLAKDNLGGCRVLHARIVWHHFELSLGQLQVLLRSLEVLT